MQKVAIVGAAGTVGSTAGYKLALKDIVDEIVYIDLLEEKAKGQALDTMHAAAYDSDTKVYEGTYEDAKNSDVFLVTAGKPRKPGMSRLDLMKENASIVEEIFLKIEEVAENAVSILTTNPVDVLNRHGFEIGERGRKKVLGFGGRLDSARFRYVLSQRFDKPATSVEASVIGEHGDSQVPLFSQVSIEGREIDFTEEEKEEIVSLLKKSAMQVIERKGATEFAPGQGLVHMVEAIIKDKEEIIPCSINLDGEYGIEGVSIGSPAVLGKEGVKKVEKLDIDKKEKESYQKSAEKLKSALKKLKKEI